MGGNGNELESEGGLDDIAFLARTETRIDLLRRIADGPTDRDSLRETGVPRETLRRTLKQFEERGWVRVTGTRCEPTPLGEHVLSAFERLRAEVAAAGDVADVVEHLPADLRELGLAPFLDAEVVEATARDPTAPVRHSAERIAEADRLLLVAGGVTVETLTATRDAVRDGQEFRAVFGPSVVATVRSEPTMRELLREVLVRDGTEVRVATEDVDYSVGVRDGMVGFGLVDDAGRPAAYLATDDDRVVEWAKGTFDRLAADGEPLTAEDLSAPSDG